MRHDRASSSAVRLGLGSVAASPTSPPVEARQWKADPRRGRSLRGRWRLLAGVGGGTMLDSSTAPRGGGRLCLITSPRPRRRGEKSLLGLRGEGAEQAAGSVELSFELCLVRLCAVLHACALRHARAHWRPRKRVAAVEGALRRGRPPRHRGEEARWD
jgi:hypothetical protein